MTRERTYELDLDAPPALGAVLNVKGHAFTCVASKPWTRRSDGAAAHVVEWSASCKRCHDAFTAKTGLKVSSMPRHCPACCAWFKTEEGGAYLRGLRRAGARGKRKGPPSPAQEAHYARLRELNAGKKKTFDPTRRAELEARAEAKRLADEMFS